MSVKEKKAFKPLYIRLEAAKLIQALPAQATSARVDPSLGKGRILEVPFGVENNAELVCQIQNQPYLEKFSNFYRSSRNDCTSDLLHVVVHLFFLISMYEVTERLCRTG